MQQKPAGLAVIHQVGHHNEANPAGNNQQHDNQIDHRIAGISGQTAEIPEQVESGIVEHRHRMKDSII
ncbi:hypothetical protein D3C73_1662510 [compost metagenome]